MRDHITQDQLWPEIIFDVATLNCAVNWTKKSTFMNTKRWLARGATKAFTKMFEALWFHRFICHFACNWWMLNTKLSLRAHHFARTSFIKRPAYQNRAITMICCRWCHTQTFHICATISLWKIRSCWMCEFWMNPIHFTQILHFIRLCKFPATTFDYCKSRYLLSFLCISAV